MPSHSTDETLERPPIRPSASFEFSASERACIVHLIGHKLERIERELILQTLRCKQGNRTLAAKTLGISIRSLRDKSGITDTGAKVCRNRDHPFWNVWRKWIRFGETL